MAKYIDNLETSLGEFNENYVKVRASIRAQMDEEEINSPEVQMTLDLLHSLDAVLDDLVTTIKRIDDKTKKS